MTKNLKKTKRSLQTNGETYNRIVANIFVKGSQWQPEKVNIATEYLDFLRQRAFEVNDNFLDVLLPHFVRIQDPISLQVLNHALVNAHKQVWHSFVKSLTTHDSKPPTSIVIEKVVQQADRPTLVAFVQSAALNSNQSKKFQKELAILFVAFTRVLNLHSDLDANLLVHDSMAMSKMPRFEPDSKQDLAAFNQMMSALHTSFLDVELQGSDGKSVQILTWLRQVLRSIVSNPKYHVEQLLAVLSSAIDLSPTLLAPIIGIVTCNILFTGLKSESLFKKLLVSHLKMRQIPKLVAKLFISLQSEFETGSVDISSQNVAAFADVVPMLPSAQLLELWKTFLYHLGSGNEPARKLCDVLMPILIDNGSFVEHSLPLNFVEKVANLVEKTETDQLPNIKESLGGLQDLMVLYRDSQLENQLKRKSSEVLKKNPKRAKSDLDARVVQEDSELQRSIFKRALEHIRAERKEKWLKKVASILLDNWNDLDEAVFKEHLEEAFKLVAKHLDSPFHDKSQVSESIQVLPLEHIRGNFEAAVSAVLLAVQDFALLSRCWDSTFRATNTLKFVRLGAVLPSLTLLEKESLTASKLLAKTGVNFQKTLVDFEPFLDEFCGLLSSNPAAAILLLEALEKPLLYADLASEKRTLCTKYFQAISKALLKQLKTQKEESDATALAVRGLGAFYNVQFNQKDSVSDKKTLGVKILPKFVDFAIQHPGAESSKFLHSVCCGLETLSQFKELDGLMVKIWEFAVHDRDSNAILTTLISNSDEDLFQKMMDVDLDINTAIVLIKASIENEAKANLRRQKVESAITAFYRNFDGPEVQNMLKLCEVQQALMGTDVPILTSHMESILLRKLPSTESVFRTHGKSTFVQVWNEVYNVFSIMMSKRFGFLVRPRIHLAFGILRNLYHGLITASNQDLKQGEVKDLVTLSHYWDRCLDQVRNLKEDFARVIPYLVSDILEGFQHVTVLPAVKANISSGLYKLLDICDKHSVDYLVGVLPHGTRELFKDIVSTYNTYHRYSGKI